MRRRVGITTDVNRRKQEWEAKYSTLKNWKIIQIGLTKEQAQSMEDDLKTIYGHQPVPGGPDASGKSWSVYAFDY